MGALIAPMTDYRANIARLNILRQTRDADNPAQVEAIRQAIVAEEGPLLSFGHNLRFELQFGFPIEPMAFRSFFAETLSGWCITLVNGVASPSTGNAVWDGYLNAAPGQVGVYNAYLRNQGIALADTYLGVPSTAPNNIFIGHSAGGALAFYAYQRLWLNRRNIAKANFILYGCPKFTSVPSFDVAPVNTIRHWMNDDDPVPFIPPTLPTWQRIWAGLSIFQANRLTYFTAIAGGVVLNILGEPQLSTLPTNIGPSPPDAIGAWLAAVEQGRTTSHSIEAYLSRFLAGSNIRSVADQPLLGTSEGGDYGPEPIARTRRQVEAAQESIIRQTERGVTEAQTVIPAGHEFKAYRRGRIWYVSFHGVQVATAPNKKRARGLARAGNDLLRRLLIEHQVEGNALTQQLANWIIEASSDNGGYFPTLNNAG